MSKCRFIVYFESAERRGEEDEVFNGCPKGKVVIKRKELLSHEGETFYNDSILK